MKKVLNQNDVSIAIEVLGLCANNSNPNSFVNEQIVIQFQSQLRNIHEKINVYRFLYSDYFFDIVEKFLIEIINRPPIKLPSNLLPQIDVLEYKFYLKEKMTIFNIQLKNHMED